MNASEFYKIPHNFFKKKLEKKRQMKYNSNEIIFGEINESSRLE